MYTVSIETLRDNSGFGSDVVYYIKVSDDKNEYVTNDISHVIKQSYRQLAFQNGANEENHELGIYYEKLNHAEKVKSIIENLLNNSDCNPKETKYILVTTIQGVMDFPQIFKDINLAYNEMKLEHKRIFKDNEGIVIDKNISSNEASVVIEGYESLEENIKYEWKIIECKVI